MAKSQKEGGSKRGRKAAEDTSNNGSLADLIDQADFISPTDIINNVASKAMVEDEELDRQYNPLETDAEPVLAGEDELPLGPGMTRAPLRKSEMLGANSRPQKIIPHFDAGEKTDQELIEKIAPKIRKVVIRKISRYNFRLGMEKAKDAPKLVPGVGHRFVCDLKGNEYVTGFDDKRYDQERIRLEKKLRVDLTPASKFWASLTYRLEDKEHGQIMNFDDPQFGPMNEVIYFAMLGSSIIANGYHEYSSGKKPMAEWYIEDKEAEAEAESKNITQDLEAAHKYEEMSSTKRRGISKLLGLPVWGATDKVVNAELFKFIRKDEKFGKPTQPGENAREFLAIAGKSDVELNVRILVADSIQMNVLRKNKSQEYFIGDVLLGASVDSAVSKLVLPQYSEVREAIANQLRKKNI